MNTNSKAYRAAIRAHILASLTDYTGPDDQAHIARAIFARFHATHNYPANVKRFPNAQARIADWLAGIPLNIAVYNGDIVDFAQEAHGKTFTPAQADRIITNWFNHCAFHILKMCEEAGIDPHKIDSQGTEPFYS